MKHHEIGDQRNLIQQYAQTIQVKFRSFTEQIQTIVKKKDFNEIILKKTTNTIRKSQKST